MAHDEDLQQFLIKYGFENTPREQPAYKVCVALYDSVKDGDDFLVFKKNDEMAVGFWMEKRGWSICYLLREPYDYAAQRRAWGFVPNNFVRIVDSWTPEQVKDTTL
jgi:hypothetical protein